MDLSASCVIGGTEKQNKPAAEERRPAGETDRELPEASGGGGGEYSKGLSADVLSEMECD